MNHYGVYQGTTLVVPNAVQKKAQGFSPPSRAETQVIFGPYGTAEAVP
jgi:hypothetical protein